MGLVLIGREHKVPPDDAVKALREAFGDEVFLEWMPNSRRWAVKRRVPWNEVEELARHGKITAADIEAHMEARYLEGHEDAGEALVLHAFTVQDPKTGEPVEPGPWLVEVLQRADTHRLPGGFRQALREVLEQRKKREQELDAWYKDQVEQAVEHFDPWLRQLPRMYYRENPIGKDKNRAGRTDGSGAEAQREAEGGGRGGEAAQGEGQGQGRTR
jgi:hypothetical protein